MKSILANRRLLVIGALTVALAALALGGRSAGLFGSVAQEPAAEGAAEGGAPQMPPMPVDVDSARIGSVTDAVRATGRIEAVQAVELRSDEQGRVTEILFEEGQFVAAGTPLVRIDDALLRAQAERATADRDLSKQQLERVKRLRADHAASIADLERAEAAARSGEAALAVLQLQIERSTVKAPFGGVVGQRFVSAGDYVTSATRLLTLQTVDPQRVVIEVPERYAGQLKRGQTVDFTVAAHADKTFQGRVDFIDPVVQPEGRTIVVKARAANPGQLLKAGMFVEARLATAVRSDAVVVREDAIQPLRTANVVWAVTDGKASRRVVHLGSRWQGKVEILDGVKAGELVVVGGLERMQEGMAVAPRPNAAGGGASSSGGTSN